jgi:hypothetical protein
LSSLAVRLVRFVGRACAWQAMTSMWHAWQCKEQAGGDAEGLSHVPLALPTCLAVDLFQLAL